ncbi:O-methyltransferase-domain-containing protein [Cladorrhinum sp. PSN259]|nr:O-methyltransferase-domain-containing protein [Cladorrhinum sp. PSN259]
MTSNSPLLTRLAEEISQNTKIITDHLKSHNLPQPSFDADGPSHPIPETDEGLSAARNALIEATRALNALAVGPGETTRLLGFPDTFVLGALQVLCHFQVPQNVPLDGEISFSELSRKTGLTETLLSRFLRTVATSYYFVEPRPGFVAHTAWSNVLATDEKMRQCIWFRYTELLPTVAKRRTALAFGDTFWDYKEKHTEHMVKFGQFADAWTGGYVVDSPLNVARAYPWEKLEEGSLIVDFGGGSRYISVAIAKEHPNLAFQIQDFEHLQKESAALVRESGLQDRLSFTPYDFFDKQPAARAKVYFLRNILHNWSDSHCRRILEPLVEAMGPDSRIVICDIVLPQPGAMQKTQEVRARALDLTMWSLFNAKERSIEEWQELLANVDGRLKVTNVIGRPKMRMDSLIEVKFA